MKVPCVKRHKRYLTCPCGHNILRTDRNEAKRHLDRDFLQHPGALSYDDVVAYLPLLREFGLWICAEHKKAYQLSNFCRRCTTYFKPHSSGVYRGNCSLVASASASVAAPSASALPSLPALPVPLVPLNLSNVAVELSEHNSAPVTAFVPPPEQTTEIASLELLLDLNNPTQSPADPLPLTQDSLFQTPRSVRRSQTLATPLSGRRLFVLLPNDPLVSHEGSPIAGTSPSPTSTGSNTIAESLPSTPVANVNAQSAVTTPTPAPSIDDDLFDLLNRVCHSRRNTIMHIPRACRNIWNQVLIDCLSKFESMESAQQLEPWVLLLTVGKAILTKPKVTRASRKISSTQWIRDRCQKWRNGQWREVLNETLLQLEEPTNLRRKRFECSEALSKGEAQRLYNKHRV